MAMSPGLISPQLISSILSSLSVSDPVPPQGDFS